MFRFSITPAVKLLLIINVSIYLLFQIGLMSFQPTQMIYRDFFSLHKSNLLGFRSEIIIDQEKYYVPRDFRLVDPQTGAAEKIEEDEDYGNILSSNDKRIMRSYPEAGKFQPLQLVTYFFNHDSGGLGHILFNMLALFFLGPGVERVLGEKRFMKFYLFSGIFGGILIAFLDPTIARVVGASVAVSGVTLAYAYYFPERELYIYFLFPVKAKWLAGAFFVFSAVMVWREIYGVGGGGNISHFGHLSGMITAFLYFGWQNFYPTWSDLMQELFGCEINLLQTEHFENNSIRFHILVGYNSF